MIINDSFIKLKEEDRKRLKEFFQDNTTFIENNSFVEYENIRQFGDLYEKFLDENGLRENDILMLFLAEIRYDQLAHKITNDTNKIKAARFAIPKNNFNDTIDKWYKESNITKYVSISEINKTLQKKLEQNASERRKSIESAEGIVVK